MMKMPLVYHPDYSIDWSSSHRFPMSKFQALYQYLLGSGLVVPTDFQKPEPVSWETVTRIHSEDYVRQFYAGELDAKAVRATGLSWSEALVYRTRLEVGGTILTAKLALEHGMACQTAGGTHHAFPDRGSGFCYLNDLAVAARWVLDRKLARRILILDLDVHQGDGTAHIFADDDAVFTCSVHCEKNFPSRKQRSDWDIGLPRGVDDAAYLEMLASVIKKCFDLAQPDLVFYDAGVDVHENDRLGHLQLTDSGLLARDKMVLQACVDRKCPVAAVIGGGYATEVGELAMRHGQLHHAAFEIWNSRP